MVKELDCFHPECSKDEHIENCDDVLGIDRDSVSLDLTHSGLRDMPDTSIYEKLTEICLRQNLLTTMAFLEHNVNLEKLDMYDNRLADIGNLSNLQHLKVLDLAFNNIRDMSPLSLLPGPTLEELYLSSNMIREVRLAYSNDSHNIFANLRILELGNNGISQISGLDSLINLKELYLGKNNIEEIDGLRKLGKLEILALPNNAIKTISGLETLNNLKELYLSYNMLTSLEGHLPNSLEILDVSNNGISHICPSISKLTNLREFWANNNTMTQYSELEFIAKGLDTIYLEGNPLASNPQYRTKLKIVFPNISQIDATMTKVLGFLNHKNENTSSS